jgi:hypothetical protein
VPGAEHLVAVFMGVDAEGERGVADQAPAVTGHPYGPLMRRIERSMRLGDGRLLTWVECTRRRVCATVEDWDEDPAVDGVSIDLAELRRLRGW